jgi:hypothetical protein
VVVLGREDLASFQIHKMHFFTRETRHGFVALMISRYFFGRVALNTKASAGAAIENRNHPHRAPRITSNRSAR